MVAVAVVGWLGFQLFLQNGRVLLRLAALPPSPRPLLLLPAPHPLPMRNEQPLYRDALTLVTGPERIECGW